MVVGFNSSIAFGQINALIETQIGPLFTAIDFTNSLHNVRTAVSGMWDFAGRFHWHFLKRSPEPFAVQLYDF